MASSTPNDDWFQNAAAAQIRNERLERAELLNGRTAILGFVVGVLTEALTGQGIVIRHLWRFRLQLTNSLLETSSEVSRHQQCSADRRWHGLQTTALSPMPAVRNCLDVKLCR